MRSIAVRDDDRGGWVLSGQKTRSSRAAYAHWGFGLFRSDPAAERHRGLTYFLFPLDADGVTVRPIAQLDGEAGFAEIFFDDVFVPDSDVPGAPGDGWHVAMSTAGNERGLSLRSPGGSARPRIDSSRCTATLVSTRSLALAAQPADETSSMPGSRRSPTASTHGARSPGSPTEARWARPAR
ncbi:acyl-CoA dehydrogenase family protein [Nocardioides sp. B-3]|uniref:acyl-CoA dehydrogenase family protein n=1 Tax=Nocardioides sp. B-3 TaxID=2895565 RepID=UPI00220AC6CB|nr:acyl-CoA dehydrogenase family protein [Nocardioides sp. B-3]